MQQLLLGEGLLSWPRDERITGRYGMVALWEHMEEDACPWDVDVDTLISKHGTLVAVLNDRRFILGTGTFFTEHDYGNLYVGLTPDEPREDEWLNPRALDKVDGFLVREMVALYFEESEINPLSDAATGRETKAQLLARLEQE